MPMPPEPTDRAEVEKLVNAVDEALAEALRTPTSHRDDTPLPAYGNTPPVAQPGRAPMSQGATDASVLMIAGAGSISMISLSAGVLMYLSQYADPVVCGIVFGAPTALVFALSRFAKRAKDALPEQHHHHYEGTVYQDQRTQYTSTRGVWAKTTNQQ